MGNFREEDIPIVQRYLSDRLNETERSAFEQRLSDDHNLQKELEWYQAMFSAVEETEDQRLKSLLQTASGSKKIFLNKNNWRVAAGFLIVVCALALLYVFKTEKDETGNLFEATNITSDLISVDLIRTRQSASTVKPDTQAIRQMSVQQALLIDSLYSHGNFQQALTILESVPAVPSILFYRANCLMALDRNQEAIPILQSVESYTDEIYSNFAQWYLALAYYKIGDKDQARAYAVKAAENPGIQDFNRKKARILLEKLEKDRF